MRVKIFQINQDRDTEHLKFLNLACTHKELQGKLIDSSIYDKVFDAEIDEMDLDGIYEKFNSDYHPLFRGHSLSVSDIIETDKGAFFVDSIGFKQVDLDESQIPENDDTFKIVYVEPGKPAYATEVGKDYESLSKAVMGMLEPIYDTDDECVYIGNEEAKLIGMQGNRHMSNGVGIIAGPFMVIGDGLDDFKSLTDSEIEKYVEKFSNPEEITNNEVAQDTGYTIYGFNGFNLTM